MIPMMFKASAGEDIREEIHATRYYGNYDGALLGFELKSDLIAEEASPPPEVEDPVTDFVPAVRAGRRAPHVWVDDAQTVSVLDGFGRGYALVLGANVDAKPWADCVERISTGGLPISIQELPQLPAGSPYANDAVVLVRPDGIIADHWKDGDVEQSEGPGRIERRLPLA